MATPPSAARLVIDNKEYYCRALKDFSVFDQINATAQRYRAHATGFVHFRQRNAQYIVTFQVNPNVKFEIEDFIRDYIFTHERYGDV